MDGSGIPKNLGGPGEDRFNNICMFLKHTEPRGYTEYYNPRMPLLGKEVSVGILDKTDMLANDMMCWAILELFYEGQIDIAWDLMTWYQNDMKATMSIDGKLLDSLTSQEYRYTQTQAVHEYQHPVEKKRWLSGNKQETK